MHSAGATMANDILSAKHDGSISGMVVFPVRAAETFWTTGIGLLKVMLQFKDLL